MARLSVMRWVLVLVRDFEEWLRHHRQRPEDEIEAEVERVVHDLAKRTA